MARSRSDGTLAYELYLSRGGGDGQDLEDWLIAEREMRHQPPLRRDKQKV